MVSTEHREWLLLIHQIPPNPNALRVKIWRKLQQIGAVAIKQSVYVMPHTEQSREDLSWTLKEIVEGGGDGLISEARFIEGLSDEQVFTLFRNARRSDYEKLIQEANVLLTEWTLDRNEPGVPTAKGSARLHKLHRRLDEIRAIDFFQTPEHATAELLVKELENRLGGRTQNRKSAGKNLGELLGKIWVTRSNIFVDRIACGWLIRKFVDKAATFKFVPGPHYAPKPNEVRFDMYDCEYTHEGDRCTFEVMIQRLKIQDHALGPLAEVVHDIDLKDDKFGLSETDGFTALLTGLVASHQNDDQRMNEGLRLFDNLYAYYQRQKRE
ncbi:MAG: chromate resistance protein ChrB domain-containing protein [Thermodesulfobacteriota bacterium]